MFKALGLSKEAPTVNKDKKSSGSVPNVPAKAPGAVQKPANRKRSSLLPGGNRAGNKKMSVTIKAQTASAAESARANAKAEAEAAPSWYENPLIFYGALWLFWLFYGTVYYAYGKDGYGWAKGFYMAVNIGYSIGWGDLPETNAGSRWFSTFYVIVGASFVGLALGFFADKVVEDRDNWFENARQKREYENLMTKDTMWYVKVYAFCQFESEKLMSVVYWLVWVAIMVIYSCAEIGWAFDEGLYFAVSSCSTGGHWAIPSDSATWMYALTGFMAAIGVPLMGIAMGSLAQFLIPGGDLEAAKESINEPVTEEELQMLQKYGLTDDDGIIDKSEFVIMCMVRTGVDPNLIELIMQRFNLLDDDKSGGLSLAEILQKSKELAAKDGDTSDNKSNPLQSKV